MRTWDASQESLRTSLVKTHEERRCPCAVSPPSVYLYGLSQAPLAMHRRRFSFPAPADVWKGRKLTGRHGRTRELKGQLRMKFGNIVFGPLRVALRKLGEMVEKYVVSLLKRVFCETERALVFALILFSLAAGMWLAMASGGFNVWRFFLPLKALGVFVAGFGCLYGGILAERVHMKALRLAGEKAVCTAVENARKSEEEKANMRKERDDARQQLSVLRGKYEKAEAELRERRGCGLDVGFVRSVAELNLAEAEVTIDKFYGEDWEDPSVSGWRSRAVSWIFRKIGTPYRSSA